MPGNAGEIRILVEFTIGSAGGSRPEDVLEHISDLLEQKLANADDLKIFHHRLVKASYTPFRNGKPIHERSPVCE